MDFARSITCSLSIYREPIDVMYKEFWPIIAGNQANGGALWESNPQAVIAWEKHHVHTDDMNMQTEFQVSALQ